MISLLPQITQLRATSLDALRKNVIPLVMMHVEYILLKKHGEKTNPEALLHSNFIKKLAACTTSDDFEALANATKEFLQLPKQLMVMINKLKFHQITEDLAEQYTIMFNSQFTSTRIKHLARYGLELINNDRFKRQIYDHVASIFSLLEQGAPSILCHFTSLMSLGTTTDSLARQHNWDAEYIQRVRNLYKLEETDAQRWMTPFNKYLERRADFRGAARFLRIILGNTIRPDPKFDLTKIQINSMTVQMEIDQDDLKMITLSTDILNMEGTIYQLERTFSTSTEFEDNDQISTVDEVIKLVQNIIIYKHNSDFESSVGRHK
ncbi:MAG: hypothetical protein CL859_10230 [Cyanobium sp. ARS6]|nr:hypothetical protein [Cyanobium sp. ARS6]